MARLYSTEHVWMTAIGGGRYRLGITDFAQRELGDIAYIELPPAGRTVRRGDTLCAVDSLKSSSDIAAPVSGIVIAVNEGLGEAARCAVINADPYGEGWLLVLEAVDPTEAEALLTEDGYREHIRGL